MLKWLVTRGPTTAPQPPRKVVTDDPLATLRVKTKDNTQQIYAVSRVNPLYHDEEVEITTGLEEEEEEEEEEDVEVLSEVTTRKERGSLPESPPTDRGSVRSSGYGSKDSASEGSDGHEDYLLGAEVEASLKPPPAPSPFCDSHAPSGDTAQISGSKEGVLQDSNMTGKAAASQSVAQLCKSFEDLSKSRQKLPAVISSGGKPVAAIMAQHPQFVKAIEVGMRRARSLETIQQPRQIDKSGSSTVPRPIWPRINSTADNFHHNANRNQHLHQLRQSVSAETTIPERTPSPVDIVKQDFRFVTSIHVTPKRPLSRAKTFTPGHSNEGQRSANYSSDLSRATKSAAGIRFNDEYGDEPSFTRYFGGGNHSADFSLLSLQPDSLVTEETLKMMRYGRHEVLEEEEPEPPIHAIEKDIKAPLPDFSQMMYTRGLYATLNRAASLSTKDIVKPPYKTRSRSIDISIPSRKMSAKKKGLSSMRDLWEKSGLKTNGRKLIVDVNDLLDDRVNGNDHERSSLENLCSLQSAVMTNALRPSKTDSSLSSSPYHNLHTYEDPMEFGHRHAGHPAMGSMESRFSDDYTEINDLIPNGIDNPAFLDDTGHQGYNSQEVAFRADKKPRFLHPVKMAEFQKKISEKLQGAPHHRTQWLDLDEIVIDGLGDKQERRVTFTSDTVNPDSLDRKGGGSRRSRTPPIPGGAVRTIRETDVQSLSGRQLPEVTLKPSSLVDSIRGQKGLWTSSESYRDRFQEAPAGSLGRGRRQQLWETYYGTHGSMDHTLPRHLAPHPNSQAPMCATPAGCHDFTLDLRRSRKLQVRSIARQKRRRCYTIVLVITAFVVFIGMVVVISWYCTGGQKFFGSI